MSIDYRIKLIVASAVCASLIALTALSGEEPPLPKPPKLLPGQVGGRSGGGGGGGGGGGRTGMTLGEAHTGGGGLAAGSAGKANPDIGSAVFAGGCFWCMEPPFDALPGVLFTTSGYTGGHVVNPTYEQVCGWVGGCVCVCVTWIAVAVADQTCAGATPTPKSPKIRMPLLSPGDQVSSGSTGHAEALRVVYNESMVSYEALLAVFWSNVDPFAVNAQFCDHGNQARPRLFLCVQR